MICPNCGSSNNDNNNYCLVCSTKLDKKKDKKYKRKEKSRLEIPAKGIRIINTIINVIVFGPIIFAGIYFLFTGIFFTIVDKYKIRDYDETIAYFKEVTDCEYESSTDLDCKGIYEYEVDGKKYTYKTVTDIDTNEIPEEETIYYDPNNPEESLIYISWFMEMLIGGIILVFAIVGIKLKRKALNVFINSEDKIVIEH